MLDKNALLQLQSLKQEIQDSIPRFSGRVRASSGRYGFVNSDEGKSYFLSPEEMDKVLPGDLIDFRVETSNEGKEQAIVEKVISSEISEIYGRYIVRGKGHFIEADHGLFNRWIFVPPAKRLGAQDGDLVQGHLSQHPFPTGKTQAHVDMVFGGHNSAGVERVYTMAKWSLPYSFSEAAIHETKQLIENHDAATLTNRIDLSHLAFVTIDSASTRDIDDALFAEAQSAGWTLWVAIADPSALVLPDSALDRQAATRTTSVYFPDRVIPMLPTELSEQLCSLQENELRPALVVELRIEEDGSVRNIHIHQANIKSHAKLTYTQVEQFIEESKGDIQAEIQGPLLHLHNCALALAKWRSTNALLVEERPDFKLVFNEQGKVQEIIRLERTSAHRLVEECMLACNRSVADWLAEQNSGFFIEHSGLRTERLGDAMALLQEELKLETKPDFTTLASFVSLFQQAEQCQSAYPLRMILNRWQDRSNYSLAAKPHMGLGFAHYTTFTSPLRKYNDMLIHRIVKALLNGEVPEVPSAETLDDLQSAQNDARTAAVETETWLKLQWLENQDKEQVYEGTLIYLTQNSFTVRLNESGIEGAIDRRKAKDCSFSSKTMSQKQAEQEFKLGQVIKVKVAEVQPQARILKLQLL